MSFDNPRSGRQYQGTGGGVSRLPRPTSTARLFPADPARGIAARQHRPPPHSKKT